MRSGTLLLLAFAVLALACGGSSSETPWPREPEGPALDPAGESAPASTPIDETELPADEGAPEDREGAPGEPPAPRVPPAPPAPPAPPGARR